MKLGRPKTEKWHNNYEGDANIGHKKHKNFRYFAKGFWKRYDRKKFYREKETT